MQQQHISVIDVVGNDERDDPTPLLAVAERFRVMAEAAFEAIAITEHGRIIDVNPQFCEMLGYELPDIIGTSVSRFIAPQDRELVRQNNLIGVTHAYEAMAQRWDGTTLPTEMFGRPMTYLGRPVRVTAVRDITDRKRAEESLRLAQEELEARVAIRTAELAQANEFLQAEIVERQWTELELQRVLAQSEQMLSAITSILIGVDQDGCITIWNTPARRAFGPERDEVMGKRLAECGLSWEWATVQVAIAECEATQRPARAEDVRYLCDGKERFLGITVNPVSGHCDVFMGYLLLAADITERRRTEEALREREATLRRSNSVLQAQQEAGPDGILIVDENRHIVSFNRRFREMWGVPAIHTESGDDHRVLSNVLAQMRDPDEFMAKVQHLYEHPTETSRDELHLTDRRVFDRYSGPVAGEDGQHFGRLWYFRDITERKILESQLAQSQKLESIGQLAAGVAHELNTPIQYVGDNARFLQNSFADLTGLLGAYGVLADAARSGPVPPALVEDVDAAAENADLEYLLDEIPNAITQSLEGVGRVAAIVHAMKEFSHPGTAHKTAVDLNRAIESTATVARSEWKYVADLVTDFDPDLPTVPCLPGELNQVFLNIIVNAAHAIGDVVGDGAGGKGTITVTTRSVPAEAPSHAEVRIADSGTGIRPEIRSKIFDPFFTTKEVGRGTGQGLSIAHGIVVEKHGGTIACESEVGRGTTFIIRLPLAADGGGA